MYDIIANIINHTTQGSYYTSEEQLIYAICGAVVLTVFFIVIDLLFRVFRNFIK